MRQTVLKITHPVVQIFLLPPDYNIFGSNPVWNFPVHFFPEHYRSLISNIVQRKLLFIASENVEFTFALPSCEMLLHIIVIFIHSLWCHFVTVFCDLCWKSELEICLPHKEKFVWEVILEERSQCFTYRTHFAPKFVLKIAVQIVIFYDY